MKLRVFAAVIAGLIAVTAITLWISRKKEFLYAGTVEATDVVLSSRLNAVIDKVLPEEGAKVKAGETLVVLSAEDVTVAANAAARDFARASELLKSGSLNRENFDKFRFRHEDAQVKLGWAVIKSPLDATVTTRFHEPGEMVAPGTKLLTLVNLKKAWAYIYIPQAMLPKVSVNMKVKAFVPESGMKEITGRVARVNDEAEFTPKNVQTRAERTRLVYGVKLELDNSDEFLKPGMTVEVRLPK